MSSGPSPAMDVKSIVVLSPEKELQFRRPFTSVVKRNLVISNAHPTVAIAFKVKTTAPKQYCVRPNSAVVPPNTKLEVQVLLQAMKEDPPADYISKDKFLVQVIKVPGDILNLANDELAGRLQQLWTQAEQLSKSSPAAGADVMFERKLKCVFLPADSATEQDTLKPSTANRISDTTAPIKQEFSDATASPRMSEAAKGGPSAANLSSTTAAQAAAPLPAADTKVSPTEHTDKPPAPTSAMVEKELREAREKAKTLQAACDGYKAEIERLNMLRQRRGESGAISHTGSAGGNTALQTQHVGLPMPVGAGIAVAAFLIGAYMF
ncbi:PapD-like protein [Powellomyces hirtus]|nr:PapD-like protein [Powellomyces hirtus]